MMSEINSSIRTVQSGLALVSEEKITWRIERFDVIAVNENLIKSQKFTFEIKAGASVPKTNWKVYLNPVLPKNRSYHYDYDYDTGNEKMIEVYYCHIPSASRNNPSNMIIHKAFCCIRNPNGEVWKSSEADGQVHMTNSTAVGTSSNNATAPVGISIMKFESDVAKLPLIDRCLSIDITIEVYQVDKVQKLKFGDDPELQLKKKMKAHFLQLLNSGEESDIVLISKEGVKFPAHKCILRARSQVKDTMFKNEWAESKNGEIKLDDMPAPAVKLLLHYIYTGEILPYSTNISYNEEQEENNEPNSKRPRLDDAVVNQEADLEDVLNISQKYGFVDLYNYVDANLIKYCNEQNASNLFYLCGLHDLKSKDLIRTFIKNHPAVLDDILF